MIPWQDDDTDRRSANYRPARVCKNSSVATWKAHICCSLSIKRLH